MLVFTVCLLIKYFMLFVHSSNSVYFFILIKIIGREYPLLELVTIVNKCR